MILIPIAIFCFIHVFIHLFKKKWKNAVIYLFVGISFMLTYALWGQSHLVEYQKGEISELNKENLSLKQDAQKIKIEQKNPGD